LTASQLKSLRQDLKDGIAAAGEEFVRIKGERAALANRGSA
jgi:hypothetical protein